jgi:hypothetical protein
MSEVDRPVLLVTQDLLEIHLVQRDEGARRISRRAAEGGIVVGKEAFAQIRISAPAAS